jgi:hypothetical protein
MSATPKANHSRTRIICLPAKESAKAVREQELELHRLR